MALHGIDLFIIFGYLAATLTIGFWISNKAAKDMRGYYLGGNKLPWYALGLSNASGMFDVAGTMWLVSILFIYGLKSIWIPWLWPVFNQIFLMVFLSIWLRRSGALTGAEWITLRFGDGKSARMSHMIVVVFALIMVLAYMAYGFLGIGKLAAQFMPFDLAALLRLNVFLPEALQGSALVGDELARQTNAMMGMNEKVYGVLIIFITSLYVIKGGMYSVVFTEVLQFFIMALASVGVAYIAMTHVSTEALAAAIPEDWANPFFDWKLDLDWSKILPSANTKIEQDGYSLFTIFFMLVLFKGILGSMAGPAPNYDMQRVLSARSPVEAAKMSWFVNVVMIVPRYLLIAGLTILALVYFTGDLRTMGENADFEGLLAFVLSQGLIPAGLLGLVLAGLFAAFMSSFAAPLNAAPAYVVNDIYRKYINPHASEKKYLRISYLVSAIFVLTGTIFGLFLTSIDGIINWITAGLGGGYVAANMIKWYWWRMNGWGYFWGMFVGIAFALLLGLPFVSDKISAIQAFPFFFFACLVAVIVGSLATKPTEMSVLQEFYIRTRPWGFWKPVQNALEADGKGVEENKDMKRDLTNVAVGIVWQSALVAAPVFFVIRDWDKLAIAVVIIAITSVFLKYRWWDNLRDYAPGYTPPTPSSSK